jgi:hypothetical protein
VLGTAIFEEVWSEVGPDLTSAEHDKMSATLLNGIFTS